MSWGEYRQADFLKENLKYKMDWIVKAYRYKKFIEIENKAELEFRGIRDYVTNYTRFAIITQ